MATYCFTLHTLPDETDPQVRNEGVGILLGRHAIMAWKNAGETWEAVSSCVVTARLKVVGRGQRQPGGSRETSSTHVSSVCICPNCKGSSWSKGQVL